MVDIDYDKVLSTLNELYPEHEKLITLLLSKDFVSEATLSEKLGIRVNDVRKILYDIYEKNLCEFKKVREDNGWFVYFWRIVPERVIEVANNLKLKELSKLERTLDYERSNQFFKCKNGCSKVTYQEALETDFICPACGDRLKFFNNLKLIRELKRRINVLRTELS